MHCHDDDDFTVWILSCGGRSPPAGRHVARKPLERCYRGSTVVVLRKKRALDNFVTLR